VSENPDPLLCLGAQINAGYYNWNLYQLEESAVAKLEDVLIST